MVVRSFMLGVGERIVLEKCKACRKYEGASGPCAMRLQRKPR